MHSAPFNIYNAMYSGDQLIQCLRQGARRCPGERLEGWNRRRRRRLVAGPIGVGQPLQLEKPCLQLACAHHLEQQLQAGRDEAGVPDIRQSTPARIAR